MPLESHVLTPCPVITPHDDNVAVNSCRLAFPELQGKWKKRRFVNRPCKCPKIPPHWFWLGPLPVSVPNHCGWENRVFQSTRLELRAHLCCSGLMWTTWTEVHSKTSSQRKIVVCGGWGEAGMETSNKKQWSLPQSVDVKNTWAEVLFLKRRSVPEGTGRGELPPYSLSEMCPWR